ncbi:unnamed protein product, partial [Mesorhabditis belari]|uniref:GTP-binding protein Rhes n=1 Tax=Mesorhabditis belari TaxID=2138241 RepID=A0AAF3F336_9BILA
MISMRRTSTKRLHRLPSKPGEILQEGQSCPNSPAVKKTYRLVVVGSPRCGKTAVVDRFLDREFQERYIPTIENFHRKLYKIRGEVYQLDVVDCSGNDPFPAARKLCYLSGDMFLIVSSVDAAHSVEAMTDFAQQITDCKTSRNEMPAKVPMVFLLNKSDLPDSRWQVSPGEAEARLSQADLSTEQLVQCSAATGDNIDKALGKLFQQAKCPKHMNPELHKMLRNELSADGEPSASSSKNVLRRMRSKFSKDGEEELAVYTDVNARRPSLRTDLLMNRAKTQVHKQTSNGFKGDPAAANARCTIM